MVFHYCIHYYFYCGWLNIWWTRHYLYGFVYCVWHYLPIIYAGHAVAAFQECTCSIGSAAWTLHYLVDEKGFTVSQGEESANLPWDQIYKMVATKSNVLVYSTRINAYIIPREQLGEQYKDLAKIANEKLPKHRVKMQ